MDLKKRSFGLVAVLSMFWVMPASAVTIIFSGDFFMNVAGQGIPDGAIVQLVVSTENDTFEDPTTGMFAGEVDDIVLATTTADSIGGFFNQGLASGILQNRNFDVMVDAGDPLLLRWWPTLTRANGRPGAETPYAEYRPVDDATITEGSDHPFVMPDNQSANIQLAMRVDFAGGASNPGGDVTLGDIRFLSTPIPELETGLLVLFGACGLALRRRRG